MNDIDRELDSIQADINALYADFLRELETVDDEYFKQRNALEWNDEENDERYYSPVPVALEVAAYF